MPEKYGIRPGQSVELLKELHILTRDGKLNQDSRRKLKQVYHLYQFIEPLMQGLLTEKGALELVDHGAGKSYLGFILYDMFCRSQPKPIGITGIEARPELVERADHLAKRCGFSGMRFLNLSVSQSSTSALLPATIDIVTALHACNTATDDTISFALQKQARHIVLVPCCQTEVAGILRTNKARVHANPLSEIWRHALHTREFGSHLTNVLRCLQLEASGYRVTVTELIGWEHSLKNELIIASANGQKNSRAEHRLTEILSSLGLEALQERFAPYRNLGACKASLEK